MAELPESIENLTSLTSLNVYGNQLTSEFPKTFLAPPKPVHGISKTEHPEMAELPESIGNLKNLKDFRCHENKLTGEYFIPSSPNETSTRYLTSCVVDSEVAFLLAIEGKLPNLTSLDFDICRTKRMEGAISTLDCSNRNLAGEFSENLARPTKSSAQYLRLKNSIRQSCRNPSEI